MYIPVSVPLSIGEIGYIKLPVSAYFDIKILSAAIGFDITKSDLDFEIFSFENKILTLRDYSEKVKGYIVYSDGNFRYEKGSELMFETGLSKTKIIPVTFSFKDYIASAEGAMLIILTAVLTFLITLGLQRRKLKLEDKW